MVGTCDQSWECVTAGAVEDKCYLLSLPREVRDQIWGELFLRNYALRPSYKRWAKNPSIYRGDGESNPFNSKGYQCRRKDSDEVFVPELFIVMRCPNRYFSVVGSDDKVEDPQSRALFGVEVLRTCKQICGEGLDALYSRNAFQFAFQFDMFRQIKHMQHFRKWMQPARVKGGKVMWSSETLTAVSQLFDPLEQPEIILGRPIALFVQSIGKQNATRIQVIHFRIILTPFGPSIPESSQPHDVSQLIEKYNLIFNHTLIGLKELRMAGYWDNSLGKRAFSSHRQWQDSPNHLIVFPIPSHKPYEIFCRASKNIETFVKRVPQDISTQVYSNSSVPTRPMFWSDVIELRKMNQRRVDERSATLTA